MRDYIPVESVEETLRLTELLEYPRQEINSNRYLSNMRWGKVDGVMRPQPVDLFYESLHVIGSEPKHILDVGCGDGRHGLILAELGHYVTAIDINDESLELARERARDAGIPNKNFVPRKQDLRDLTTSDTFEAVLAIMAVHFLPVNEVKGAIRAIQAATTAGGVNVIDAYTIDNPPEESSRGIRHFFLPGELGRLCVANGWTAYRNVEGPIRKSVDRSQIAGPRVCLIPTVAEVISRKPSTVALASSQSRTYMTANRQIITI